jgi:soluble lytic murein transglycosylase-like protein
LARRSLIGDGMLGPTRIIAAVLALLTPASLARPASPVPGTPAPSGLTATLRGGPAAAPRWLAATVCSRASELPVPCGELARAIAHEARQVQLDPVLVLAIIEVESGWDPGAVSERDAHGLMQLRLPTLAGEASPSADPHDPLVNVRAGIRYYARLLRQFRDVELALVAYNAGPRRLRDYLRAEEGVPERFWQYPQRVRREERRLRQSLASPVVVVATAD